MPFSLRTLDPVTYPAMVPHRVVPVRFARAVTGFADADAPDLDDHGFIAADEHGPDRGPTVGIKRGTKRNGVVQPGPTVRIKVIRDRIDPGAQLFPVIADTSIAELVSPVADAALSPTTIAAAGTEPERVGDCIYFRSSSTQNGSQETKLSLHCGSATGPALAEMTIRVHPVLYITVKLHKVAIKGGTAPATSMATLRRMFRKVNAIYCQAGIEFALESTIDTETITRRTFSPGVFVDFLQQDLVTRDVEARALLTVNPQADALNGYYFPDYASAAPAGFTADLATLSGWAISRTDAAAGLFDPATLARLGQPGITFRDPDAVDFDNMSYLIAHEIGHALTLEHYNNGQRSATNTDGTIRHDIWAHRNLMHNYWDINAAWGETYHSSAARVQIGYGAGRTGSMLMIKKRTGRIFQSDQVNIMRRSTLAGTYKPF